MILLDGDKEEFASVLQSFCLSKVVNSWKSDDPVHLCLSELLWTLQKEKTLLECVLTVENLTKMCPISYKNYHSHFSYRN